MRCENCNQLILKEMFTPNIYYRNESNLPVFSYTYKCSCNKVTTISAKQFNELKE